MVREAPPTESRAPSIAPIDPGEHGALAPGARVAQYEILALLGAGGMGEVYRAHDERLRRDVAIKVLRGGRAHGEHGAERLLHEAQAIARLSHPNVVTIYEVGTVDDQVFLAMEYVAGWTLRQWLDERRRARREIIDVFLRAGRGLAAAHQAGLVHRDFKPDNVLIGRDGRVRVSDFGLAAGLDGDGLDAGGPSPEPRSPLYPLVSGTPAYMSPEQARRAAVDARTDQYAFAVALFEALYGVRPFTGTSLEEREALVAGRLPDGARGSSVPAWLRAILLRGLAIDPAARYPSMAGLLDALGRDPAARRRRVLYAAGALGLAGLVAWGVSRPSSPPPCVGLGRELAGVWDAQVATKVRAALTSRGAPYAEATFERVRTLLDRRASAWTAMRTEACEATAVRHTQSPRLLDLRMRCLDRRKSELAALGELYARPDADVGERAVQAVEALGELAACADADALSSAIPPPEAAELRAQVASQATELDRIAALEATGQWKEALPRARAAVQAARDLPYPPTRAEATFLLAMLERDVRDPGAEAAVYDAIRAAAEAKDDLRTARAWLSLMQHIGADGTDYTRAMELRPAADAAIARAGDPPALRANFHMTLGNVQRVHAQLADAQRELETARAAYQAIPDRPPIEAGAIETSLGVLAAKQGNYEEARAHAERSVALYETTLGPEHPFVAGGSINLANALFSVGRYPEAQRAAERALRIWEGVYGPEHPNVAMALNLLGNVLYAQRKFEEARRMQERVVAIKEKTLGPEHPQLAATLSNLGSTLIMLNRNDEAIATERRALAIHEKALGPDHPAVADDLSKLTSALLNGDQLDEALALERRALAIREHKLQAGHPDLAISYDQLGEIMLARGKPAEAEAWARRGLAVREKSSIAPPLIAHMLDDLADALQAQDRWKEAEDARTRQLEILRAHDPHDPDLARALVGLVECQLALHQPVDLPALERLMHPEGAPDTVDAGSSHPELILARAEYAASRREQAIARARRASAACAAAGRVCARERARIEKWLAHVAPGH